MKRTVQSIVLLVLAIAQIATARLTVMLGIGEPVEVQSAVTSHPLVPYSSAFVIWGLIYFFSLVAAVWQVLPRQRDNAALGRAGWHMAVVWLINSLWQVWVPLMGLDWVSFALIAIAVFAALKGLMVLRDGAGLSTQEKIFIFTPLALVGGWITAAAFVNFTSAMLWTGIGLDPGETWVSAAFLIGLIAFGGVTVWLTDSGVYAAALVWALFWILIANQERDHEPVMVILAAAGMAAVIIVRGLRLWRGRSAVRQA